jgi:hypothetical protein
MKIFENITNGYRKIASGIAIVAFLALLYFALIPAGSMALSYVAAASGSPIIGAIVKLVDYPQYNATTVGPDGNYVMNSVPYGDYLISAQAPGYVKNVSMVNVSSSAVTKNFTLTPGSLTGDYRYISLIDNELTANKVSTLSDVGKSFVIPQYGNGASFNTTVYVTDYSGSGASLTVQYYDVNGNLNATEHPSVPPYGTIQWIPSDNTSGRPLVGKLVITSDNNITGEFKIYSTSNTDMLSSKLYQASDAGTTLTIPQYGNHAAWYTFVAVADYSGNGANLTLKYYDVDGVLRATEYQTLPANGMYRFNPSDGSGTRPWVGKLEIISDNPSKLVTGEYRIISMSTGGMTSNKLFTSADKGSRFFVPQYGNGVTWSSWVAIADASGLGANIRIDYYHSNGTFAATELQTIPANGMSRFFVTDGTNGRPQRGKFEVTSNNPIMGEIRIISMSNRGLQSTSLFTDRDVNHNLIVPYFGDYVGFNTFIALGDTSGYDTPITVEYRGMNGVLVKTDTPTVPANGVLSLFVAGGTGGVPTEGNVFIYT